MPTNSFRQKVRVAFGFLGLAFALAMPAYANTYDYTFDFDSGPIVSFETTSLLSPAVQSISGNGNGISNFSVQNCVFLLDLCAFQSLSFGYSGGALDSATLHYDLLGANITGISSGNSHGGTVSVNSSVTPM